jgi:hypothetical protein
MLAGLTYKARAASPGLGRRQGRCGWDQLGHFAEVLGGGCEEGCCQGKLFGSSFAPELPGYLGSSHQSLKKTLGRRGDQASHTWGSQLNKMWKRGPLAFALTLPFEAIHPTRPPSAVPSGWKISA